jgi:hypothetical protein
MLPPDGLEPRDEPWAEDEGREGAGLLEPREPWLEEGRETLPPDWEPRDPDPWEPLDPRWAETSAALPSASAASPIQAKRRAFIEDPCEGGSPERR